MAELQGLTGPSRQAGSMDIFTAIIASPTVDGVACAVIAARAARGGSETFFLNSASLTEFFRPSIQQKLPGLYSLVICDLELVHTTWDGQLVRPRLLDALRSFVSPALWLSARAWRPEDRAAVENILGPSRLVVSEAVAPRGSWCQRPPPAPPPWSGSASPPPMTATRTRWSGSPEGD